MNSARANQYSPQNNVLHHERRIKVSGKHTTPVVSPGPVVLLVVNAIVHVQKSCAETGADTCPSAADARPSPCPFFHLFGAVVDAVLSTSKNHVKRRDWIIAPRLLMAGPNHRGFFLVVGQTFQVLLVSGRGRDEENIHQRLEEDPRSEMRFGLGALCGA